MGSLDAFSRSSRHALTAVGFARHPWNAMKLRWTEGRFFSGNCLSTVKSGAVSRINALPLIRKMEAEGIPTNQAEAITSIAADVLKDKIGLSEERQNSIFLQEIEKLRAELRSEFAKVNAVMKSGFAKLDGDMESGFAKLDGDMKSGFAKLDGDMKSGFAKVDADMKSLKDDVLKCLFGTSISVVVAGLAAYLFSQ